MSPIRLKMEAQGNSTAEMVSTNFENSKGYPRAEWGVLTHPPCIVVGGGASTERSLDGLRKWDGDIFAINDTAGYLSDNGIPCYLYAIDGSKIPFYVGDKVKGAVLASRCDQVQYKMFPKENIRVFDLAEEDGMQGIEGGPTAVCRTPHLFLKMGYRAVMFLGCEGSFFKQSHVGGDRMDAFGSLLIIRVDGVDYLTNAAFMLQCQYLTEVITTYPQFLFDISGGLLGAMRKHPDTWEVVAVTDSMKKQYEDQGVPLWGKPYNLGEVPIWQM
jgi:hypothetical protein